MQRDEPLRRLILDHLQAFEVHAAERGTLRAAAVAVAIADEGRGAHLPGIRRPKGWSTEAALLLTRRAGGLNSHAGQWALPGGRIDAGETPEQAALRELHEEIGLQLGADSLLGRLDDFVTRSGYVITPVLVWAGAARTLQPNPHEVQSIHRIPVSEFLRADAPMLENRTDSAHPVLRMPVGDSWIAAPTAAVLYQFRELCIDGRATRVAHFEQPRFAWK
ncbi:MAG TPA: CoA pyrophosphatase [Rubrivivax sp.]|nr:CoA pyrophosphatase [Rubrivivax sp.]